MFDQGRDVLGLDSLVDESRGSEPCIGLNCDTVLVEILENQMGTKIVEGDGDVSWQRQMCYAGCGMLGDANAGSCYAAGWRRMDTRAEEEPDSWASWIALLMGEFMLIVNAVGSVGYC